LMSAMCMCGRRWVLLNHFSKTRAL